MTQRTVANVGSRLVHALRRDPVRGWEAVLAALPTLGIPTEEGRVLAQEIRAHIRLRQAIRRLRQHP